MHLLRTMSADGNQFTDIRRIENIFDLCYFLMKKPYVKTLLRNGAESGAWVVDFLV